MAQSKQIWTKSEMEDIIYQEISYLLEQMGLDFVPPVKEFGTDKYHEATGYNKAIRELHKKILKIKKEYGITDKIP